MSSKPKAKTKNENPVPDEKDEEPEPRMSGAEYRLGKRDGAVQESVTNQFLGFLLETEGISLELAIANLHSMVDESNFGPFVAMCMFCSRVSRNALADKAQMLLGKVGEVPTMYTTGGANFKALSVTGHVIFRILVEGKVEGGTMQKTHAAYARGLGGNAKHIGMVVADAAIVDKKKKERNSILVEVRNLLSGFNIKDKAIAELIDPLAFTISAAVPSSSVGDQRSSFGRVIKSTK